MFKTLEIWNVLFQLAFKNRNYLWLYLVINNATISSVTGNCCLLSLVPDHDPTALDHHGNTQFYTVIERRMQASFNNSYQLYSMSSGLFADLVFTIRKIFGNWVILSLNRTHIIRVHSSLSNHEVGPISLSLPSQGYEQVTTLQIRNFGNTTVILYMTIIIDNVLSKKLKWYDKI